jgi:LacI family transcriptional regulator
MVTMRDVADLAGVSITTVSHVVNNTRPVAAETRERVLLAVERTGYTQDAIARSLVVGGTRALGMAIPLSAEPQVAELIQAVENEASQAGYTLLLKDTRDEPATEQAAVHALRSRRVDGLLLTPTPDAQVLPELRRSGIPVVWSIDFPNTATWIKSAQRTCRRSLRSPCTWPSRATAESG